MKLLSIFVAFLLLPFASVSPNHKHEYYVSVTKVEYAQKQKAVQITSQIFIDDFEKLLRERYDENITLATKDEPEKVNDYINRYFLDKLKVSINGKNTYFKYLGKEYKDDIAYCYFEIENITEVKSIKVTNRILFDVFEEQQNIVRLKLNNKNKSYLLIPSKDECMLNFD